RGHAAGIASARRGGGEECSRGLLTRPARRPRTVTLKFCLHDKPRSFVYRPPPLQRGMKPMTGKPHSGGCATGTLLTAVGFSGSILVGCWALGGCFLGNLDNLFNFGPDHHRARREALAETAPAAFPLLVIQLLFLPVLVAVGGVLSTQLSLSVLW